jgi:DNA polymerase IV
MFGSTGSTQAPPRVIAHVDMDAFYAAIEVRDNPQYKGLPVIIGAAPHRRGVVTSASYEARRYGIRAAMPSREAGARCPHAVFLPGDMEKYRAVSAQLFDLLDTFTPQVESVSIDEAFLDLTGCPPQGGSEAVLDRPLAFARAIKVKIREVLQLPATVGVASNKFVAKLATELAKPDGLRYISPEDVEAVLDPLPVTVLWGVGEEMQERLASLRIHTVGALRRTPTSVLRAALGFAAEHLARLSRGLDDRRVEVGGDAKSIGRETTFDQDVTDREVLIRMLAGLAEDVAHRLRQDWLAAQTVTLKVRYADFRTVTRSSMLPAPVDTGILLLGAAVRMWTRLEPLPKPVRLLGVSASRLCPSRTRQVSLFGEQDREGRVDRVVDAINARYGEGTVRRARLMTPGEG